LQLSNVPSQINVVKNNVANNPGFVEV